MASKSGVSEMMAVEGFGLFKDGKLMLSSDREWVSLKLAEVPQKIDKFFGVAFEVKPICWSVERGEFIAVPYSISI